MIKLTNNTGSLLVCDLADGETLRANVRETIEVKEVQMTAHIENLIKSGLVLKEVVPEHLVEDTTKDSAVDNKVKEKGGK